MLNMVSNIWKYMKIRNILSLLLPVALAFSSCDRAFELKLPLAVDSHRLKLSQEEGSTHILVYADGEWTASLERGLGWASLDRTSGEGNSEVVFTYGENLGIARQALIVLTKDSLRDTISLIQSGPVTNPSYRFASASNSIAVGGGRASFPVSGNLEHSTDAIRVAAIFEENGVRDTVALTRAGADNGRWITAAEPFADRLVLTLDYNVTKAVRGAEILVTIDDPTGRTMKSVMTLIQTADKPALRLESVSGTFGKDAQSVLVGSQENNIYAYSDDTLITSGEDWISDLRLTKDGLAFCLAGNDTGAMRSAVISLTYIDDFASIVKAGFTVVQKAE